MKSAIAALLAVVFICAGCVGNKASPPISSGDDLVNGKPQWYWSPSYDGAIGGVGESGFHVDGASAQRQLAIMRALEDIALQKGVKVQSVQSIQQIESNSGTSSTQVESYSVHTVDGRVLNTIVREVWMDPVTGRLVVWATELLQ